MSDLSAALRMEINSDPAGRGYAGKSAAEMAVLLNEPFFTQPATVYRNVPVSSVEGYMRLHRHIVRLRRWVASAEPSDMRDFAEEMLDMMAAANVREFETGDSVKRAAILGAFAGLAETGAGGFSAQSLADLTAMTIAPSGAPVEHAPRWAAVIEGIPGAPNTADAALVTEAINGNN